MLVHFKNLFDYYYFKFDLCLIKLLFVELHMRLHVVLGSSNNVNWIGYA